MIKTGNILPSFEVLVSLVTLSYALSCASAHAKLLTIEDIKAAQKIGIMPGTFDPITDGHMAAAKAAAESAALDMVIFVPQENPHKNPISRKQRLEMISIAAKEEPKIAFVDGGDLYDLFLNQTIGPITEKIRSLNPKAEVDHVAGSDFAENEVTDFLFELVEKPDRWIVVTRSGSENAPLSHTVSAHPHQIVQMPPLDVSSSGIKSYLQNHQELYATSPNPVEVHGLNSGVAQYVIQNGLYREPPKLTASQKLFQCILNTFWKK